MTQVTLLCVGNLKEKYWADACAEYEKRLGGYCQFKCIEIKEEKITDEGNAKKIEQALLAEGQKLLSLVPDHAYVVSLCIEGKSLDSVSLSKHMEEATSQSGKIVFIIGSSHGLHPTVKSASHLRLSLSSLTFPHQLSRVLLMESLYRSFTITAGKTYHK